MELNISISFEEAKHLVRQEYLSSLAGSTSNKELDEVTKEVNQKYKSSLKFNYLLVNGLAKEIEAIKDRQERERNEACKRKIAALARDLHHKSKFSKIQQFKNAIIHTFNYSQLRTNKDSTFNQIQF